MPDFGAPVAQNVDVNPLRSLSQILGIKHQQIGLQQQQQELQSQTAQAQQQTQTAGQRSALAGFYQHFDPTKHVGSDGTLDLDNVLTDPNLRQAAGDQFPEVMQQLIATKQGQLQTKQNLANLNDTLRDQFSGTVGSLRTDPDVVADNNVGRGKVLDAIQNFGTSGGPDAQRIAQTYGGVVQNVPKGKLASALSNFQLQAMSAGEQASHQAPTYQPVGTGATTELPQTNPQAAGGVTVPPSYRNTVGPGAIPMQDARGAPFLVNPQNPASPRQVGGGGFQSPTYQGQAADVEANQSEVRNVRQQADQAPLNRNINQNILRLSSDAKTGPGTEIWQHALGALGAAVGLSPTASYQEVGKFLEKNAINNMQAMGAPGSDARLHAAAAANGSTSFNKTALQDVTKFNDATNSGLIKYRQGIDQAIGTRNPNYTDLPRFKSEWSKNFDVNIFRVENAIRDGDREELAKVKSELGPEKMRELAVKRRNLESLSSTGELPHG